jgi:hypothetical protein
VGATRNNPTAALGPAVAFALIERFGAIPGL